MDERRLLLTAMNLLMYGQEQKVEMIHLLLLQKKESITLIEDDLGSIIKVEVTWW